MPNLSGAPDGAQVPSFRVIPENDKTVGNRDAATTQPTQPKYGATTQPKQRSRN